MKKLIYITIFGVLLIMNTINAQQTLTANKIITLPAMNLVGIKWSCTNEKLIEARFAPIQENIAKLISLGIKSKSTKLYNMAINMSEDYKKDRIKGIYDCFVALEVENLDNLPKEAYVYKFAGAKYKVFTTEKGVVSQVLFNKWTKIWNDRSLTQERAYIADFDVYNGNEDFNNSTIDIYISVK